VECAVGLSQLYCVLPTLGLGCTLLSLVKVLSIFFLANGS
jgi:hypothetical protein